MIHDTAIIEGAVHQSCQVWHHSHVRAHSVVGPECILGKNVYIDSGVVLERRCKVQNNACIYGPAHLEEGVFVGPGALTLNDKTPRAITPTEKVVEMGQDWKPDGATLRKGCSLGARSVVLGGVVVGPWAMVGAGSVVVRDVPAHAMVVGNPAKIRGWVCRCGHQLELGETRLDRVSHVCGRCAQRLTLGWEAE